MNIRRATTMLRRHLATNVPIFLWGPPGVGKSEIVHTVAAEENDPVIDFRAILRDPVDLRGVPAVDIPNKVAHWLPPSDLPNELRHGKRGILFLDELNAAPPAVQAACFGLVLDRKVGEYQMPPGWRIVAAGNRQNDRAAANRMPSALANRFSHCDVDPTIEDFLQFGLSTGRINPLYLGFVRWKGILSLHNMSFDDLRAFPTPRSWERLTKVAAGVDVKSEIDVLADLAKGNVGEATAGELLAFIRTYNDLPPFDAIIKNPQTVKVPNRPDACFAIATMLSSRIEPQHIEPALTYVERMSEEMASMFIFDLIDRDEKAFGDTEAFINWSASHMDTMTNGRRF